MNLRVAILTALHSCPERKAYFLRTLSKVRESSYGFELKVFYNLCPQFATKEETDASPELNYDMEIERLTGLTRVAYQACFDWATNGTEFGVVFEDDIDVRNDWMDRLGLFVENWRASAAFASLYTARGWASPAPIYRVPLTWFYGCQGILFKSDTWKELVEAREASSYVFGHSAGHDMWIKDTSIQIGYRHVLVQNPSIVQHVGQVSAIGGKFHSTDAWK